MTAQFDCIYLVSEILITGIAILVLKAHKPLHRDKVASMETCWKYLAENILIIMK